MLAITETAALAINTLISDNELPKGAGVRIAQSEGSQKLELSIAPAPGEHDTVVESAGANVFLEPVAAQTLEDQVLDVQRVERDGEDQYYFAIAAQAPQ
jgi:Fe-S cluster assembly iron-binding protein IscA